MNYHLLSGNDFKKFIQISSGGITDRENVEHIKEIKELLNALEEGKVVDV